jgi:fluoride exporter
MEPVGTREPVDPDVAPSLEPSELQALVVVAAGAIVGSTARYLIEKAWPANPGEVPWSTFLINLGGSFLLPFVVVAATDTWPRAWLVRPALGTGVIGGFTTFSTFALEQQKLFAHGATLTALAYIALTLLSCALAAHLALMTARGLSRRITG